MDSSIHLRLSLNILANLTLVGKYVALKSFCITQVKKGGVITSPIPFDVTKSRCLSVSFILTSDSLVFIGDEEPDPASRAHFKEGRQRGGGICFLSPSTLEEGRGSLKPTTLHLGGQYVFTIICRRW